MRMSCAGPLLEFFALALNFPLKLMHPAVLPSEAKRRATEKIIGYLLPKCCLCLSLLIPVRVGCRLVTRTVLLHREILSRETMVIRMCHDFL
jgi:hypothetical protein